MGLTTEAKACEKVDKVFCISWWQKNIDQSVGAVEYSDWISAEE